MENWLWRFRAVRNSYRHKGVRQESRFDPIHSWGQIKTKDRPSPIALAISNGSSNSQPQRPALRDQSGLLALIGYGKSTSYNKKGEFFRLYLQWSCFTVAEGIHSVYQAIDGSEKKTEKVGPYHPRLDLMMAAHEIARDHFDYERTNNVVAWGCDSSS
ncbi:hypothetical protein Nepgr_030802 [Nepenthes gracilis]|uniref:Uncharacterized protein n=1 Tax=Nepenthes gracilis TaxID=150966 RepID=A0AAD3TGV7_NEPGR|nr:hypothetical protein Nepgr_030802 [Nepenthes gracilis]